MDLSFFFVMNLLLFLFLMNLGKVILLLLLLLMLLCLYNLLIVIKEFLMVGGVDLFLYMFSFFLCLLVIWSNKLVFFFKLFLKEFLLFNISFLLNLDNMFFMMLKFFFYKENFKLILVKFKNFMSFSKFLKMFLV